MPAYLDAVGVRQLEDLASLFRPDVSQGAPPHPPRTPSRGDTASNLRFIDLATFLISANFNIIAKLWIAYADLM